MIKFLLGMVFGCFMGITIMSLATLIEEIDNLKVFDDPEIMSEQNPEIEYTYFEEEDDNLC